MATVAAAGSGDAGQCGGEPFEEEDDPGQQGHHPGQAQVQLAVNIDMFEGVQLRVEQSRYVQMSRNVILFFPE